MPEYPAAYVAFMQECKHAYMDLCQKIEDGVVPVGTKATVKITIPSDIVNRIRLELIAAASEVHDG